MEYPEEPDDADVARLQKNDDGADSDTSSLGGEEDSLRILYNAVKTYKLGAQNLIDPFMKLPNKRFHQDYYEQIKRPIAMPSIKKQIKVRRQGMAAVRTTRSRLYSRRVNILPWDTCSMISN